MLPKQLEMDIPQSPVHTRECGRVKFTNGKGTPVICHGLVIMEPCLIEGMLRGERRNCGWIHVK